jgi:hypothetical protein
MLCDFSCSQSPGGFQKLAEILLLLAQSVLSVMVPRQKIIAMHQEHLLALVPDIACQLTIDLFKIVSLMEQHKAKHCSASTIGPEYAFSD